MKNSYCFLAIAVIALSSSLLHAELVYENEDASRSSVSSTREDERATLRNVITPAEKLRSTKRARGNAPASVTTVQIQQSNPVQPLMASSTLAGSEAASAQEPQSVEVQNLSKSELMRRERVRKEIENEDLLQERLESLRLRDERQRSDQILNAGGDATAASVDSLSTTSSAPTVVTTEVVVPPATESPGQTGVAPSTTSGVSSTSTAAVAAVDSSDQSEKVKFMVQPRIGVANMNGNGLYDINPRYSAGIGVGLGVSENLIFEFGYQYNEYGFAIARSNPAVNYVNGFGINTNTEQVEMHQDVFDLGAKIPFLSADSKVRPFVGLGVGYSKSYTNYNSSILRNLDAAGLGNTLGQDYETSAYLGFLSTGLDFRVSKSVTIGAMFKYYNVFSSRQNSSINNYGLLGVDPRAFNNQAAGLGGAPSEFDKRYIGGSLERASFYSLTVGAGFSF